MSKDELIQLMKDGKEVTLYGDFSYGDDKWNYEYWKIEYNKFRCSYDGEFSHYFNEEDLKLSFNPCEAESISVN